MNAHLHHLRSRLARLRRRRQAARATLGLSALGIGGLAALSALFLGDWLLDMNPLQRLIGIVVCAGLAAWIYWRFARPWFCRRDSLLDVAILVERQARIDSDLVAALQFESPEARQWGSVQLEEAVISQAEEWGRRLRPVLDISPAQVMRRAGLLAILLAAMGMAAWWWPDHLRAFVQRLAFRPVRYPTRTVIQGLTINKVSVEPVAPEHAVVKCPYGQAVEIEVICTGRLPESGQGRLTLETSGQRAEFSLACSPDANTTSPPTPAQGQGFYRAVWPRLVDAARLELFVGDARTDPIHLVVVPPPRVEVRFEITPPAYTRFSAAGPETTRGVRQLSVPEGSRVALWVESDKPLEKCLLTLEGKDYAMVRAAQPNAPGGAEAWRWDPSGTPLAAVREPVRYAIQVVDADGLSLERPIEGLVRVQVDRPPEIVASALTSLVLPDAKPSVSFAATDDYGIAEVVAIAELIHADGTAGKQMQWKLYGLRAGEQPSKNIKDRQRLALATLGAIKGDQVRITLRAVDDRDGPGQAASSEPLVFQITDEQGLYAAMAEADRESAQRLQTMIDDQIAVGAGP